MPIGPARMPLFDHLGELRMRLVRIVVCLFIGVLIFYFAAPTLIQFLLPPIAEYLPQGSDGTAVLTALDPFEAFATSFKVALWASVVTCSPVILWQILAFFLPALKPKERKWFVPAFAAAVILFIVGTIFCYLIILNPAFQFLTGPVQEPSACEHLRRHHRQIRDRLRLRVRAAAGRLLPGDLRHHPVQEAAWQLARGVRGADGHLGHDHARRVPGDHAFAVRRHDRALRGQPAHRAHRAGAQDKTASRRSGGGRRRLVRRLSRHRNPPGDPRRPEAEADPLPNPLSQPFSAGPARSRASGRRFCFPPAFDPFQPP